MRPSAILFDLDGTLVDPEHAVSVALGLFHARHGEALGMGLDDLGVRWRQLMDLHFPRYLAREIAFQEQRRARIEELFGAAGLDLTPAAADDIFAGYDEAYRDSWTVFPDVMPALAALEGFDLAILTNGDFEHQKLKLEVTGLAGRFARIFCSSEIGHPKPQPEAFLVSCTRLGIQPERCMFVGDSLRMDVYGSSAAGLMPVWLDRSGRSSAVERRFPVVRSLTELPSLL